MSGPTEAQRKAVIESFTDAIWHSANDYEIARVHNLTPAQVRQIRADWRRDMGLNELAKRLELLAQLTGWTGSPGALLCAVVEDAMGRADVLRADREFQRAACDAEGDLWKGERHAA